MTSLTAILIALTLTGSPVPSAVCAAVCGHGTSPAAHCHESLADGANVAVAADITCGALVSEAPYVKENITAPHIAVTVTSRHVADLLRAIAAPPISREPVEVAWLRPPLILRL
jgi:hypothetical protein